MKIDLKYFVRGLVTFCLFVGTHQMTFGQLGLGNVYDTYQQTPKASKEQKEFVKELWRETKLNKASLEENLTKLQSLGYFKHIFVPNVTNDNAKFLLVIDSKLKAKQLALDSTVLTLKNSYLLDSVGKALPQMPDERRGGVRFGREGADYESADMVRELRGRYKKAVESYKLYMSPVTAETNSKFMNELLKFNKETDAETLQQLERNLELRKGKYQEAQARIAAYYQKKEEQFKYEEAQRNEVLEQRRMEQEKAQELERRRTAEIASLPSKQVVRSKFRTYKHRTGHVFELFPVGFTPKVNKGVNDYAFGRRGRYREVDGEGMNTLIIEFYDSGSILSVTVYRGNEGIYIAQYRDHAKKPYEIRTTSSDGNFYVVHKRTYDMYTGKTTETTKYQHVPLDYWYE